MSMPIQRQSEQFGVFDSGPRWERDRASHDLPKGLAGVINSMGPRISSGLLNTRTAGTDHYPTPEHLWEGQGPDRDEDGRPLRNSTESEVENFGDAARALRSHAGRTASCEYCGEDGHDWQVHPEAHRDVADWEREKHQLEFPFGDHTEGIYASRLAVNTDGMDPDSHAYHQDSYRGSHDQGGDWVGDEDGYRRPVRQWNPNFGYEPTDEDIRNHELVAEDDDSGYNWGPEPPEHLGARRGSGRLPFDLTAGHRDPVSWEQDEQGWRHPLHGFRVSPSEDTPDHWQLWSPTVGQGNAEAKLGHPHPDPQVLMDWANHPTGFGGPPKPPHVAAAIDPAQLQAPQGGGYQIGHRVGLIWRGQLIPGTVIGLEGPNVVIRWDDGQYSTEEPRNIQLL